MYQISRIKIKNDNKKPSLVEEYSKGDCRNIIYLFENYTYTNEEIYELINCHEPYENNIIPEIEHIIAVLKYSKNIKNLISEETMSAIKNCYFHFYEYINSKN